MDWRTQEALSLKTFKSLLRGTSLHKYRKKFQEDFMRGDDCCLFEYSLDK